MLRSRNKTYSYLRQDYNWHYIYGTLVNENQGWTSVAAQTRLTGDNYVDWRERIKSGLSATTSLEGVRREETLQDYSTFINTYGWVSPEWPHQYDPAVWTLKQVDRSSGTREIAHPGYDDGSFYLSMDDVTANNSALRQLYKKLSRTRTSMQGLIFLGEAREAIRMIRSPAQALRRGIGEYVEAVRKRTRRIRNPNLRKVNRILGETWLEYSFGWKPFISDLNDAHKAYFALDRRPGQLESQPKG